MRKRQREKIINLTTDILEGLLRIGGAGAHAFLDQKSFYSQLADQGHDRKLISGYVRRLINSGHIEAIEEHGKSSVRLTRKGQIKWMKQDVGRIFDKVWRFISYDIPDKHKPLRVALIRSLRRVGYKPVQKSLWVCPYQKADQIDLIISELGIDRFVANFKVGEDAMDIREHVQELFDDELP